MSGEAQAVHRTTLINRLGVFHDPSASDLPPGYSVGPEFEKHLSYNKILTCRLAPVLYHEVLKQLFKTSFPFLQSAFINHNDQSASF